MTCYDGKQAFSEMPDVIGRASVVALSCRQDVVLLRARTPPDGILLRLCARAILYRLFFLFCCLTLTVKRRLHFLHTRSFRAPMVAVFR